MDRDTPGRYEQFAPPTDTVPPAGQQPKQQKFYPTMNFGSNAFNNPNNNQPNSGQPNQGWPNQSNNAAATGLDQLKLSEKEQKILNVCKAGTFFSFTLPSCAGYYLYRKYQALKHLKPVPPAGMFLGIGCTYAVAQVFSWAYCMIVLRSKSPEFEEKVMKLREMAQQGRLDMQANARTTPAPPQQNQMANVDPNDYWTLQQQRYNNPTNPYLASNQEKKKGDSKGKSEFVDDDFDSGSDGKTSY